MLQNRKLEGKERKLLSSVMNVNGEPFILLIKFFMSLTVDN